jgi:hypothetical protein
VSPVVSLAPTTAATPTASTVGERGGPHAEALVARFAEDPFIAHIDQLAEVTTTVSGVEVSVSAGMRADLSGEDMSFVLDVEGGGLQSTQEVRVVGDTAWLKEPNGSWTGVPRDVLGDTLVGLIANVRIVTDPNDLRYVGVETKDGRELHRLTAIEPIPYSPSTGGTGQYDTLDIWTEADGTPVLVEGTITATDPNGVKGTGSTDFEFSMFGGPIDIEPPPVEPAAS